MYNTYQAVHDMTGVRVITRITPLASDEVHDLVLSFPWDAGIRDNDLEL